MVMCNFFNTLISHNVLKHLSECLPDDWILLCHEVFDPDMSNLPVFSIKLLLIMQTEVQTDTGYGKSVIADITNGSKN